MTLLKQTVPQSAQNDQRSDCPEVNKDNRSRSLFVLGTVIGPNDCEKQIVDGRDEFALPTRQLSIRTTKEDVGDDLDDNNERILSLVALTPPGRPTLILLLLLLAIVHVSVSIVVIVSFPELPPMLLSHEVSVLVIAPLV